MKPPVKKPEVNRLPDKLPSLQDLIFYLTKDNNCVMVYVKKTYRDEVGNIIYEMSNGSSFSKDTEGKWIKL